MKVKNGANINGIRKNKKKPQNHSFYLSKYSNKNKKISEISDIESSQSNRAFRQVPIKIIGFLSNKKNEEGDIKYLVNKMTKLINAIEYERRDRRLQTIAINAQTKALNDQTIAINDQTKALKAQTKALEAQTKEMRRQHGELITLMSRTMNELNLNIKKLVDKFV